MSPRRLDDLRREGLDCSRVRPEEVIQRPPAAERMRPRQLSFKLGWNRIPTAPLNEGLQALREVALFIAQGQFGLVEEIEELVGFQFRRQVVAHRCRK